MYFQKFLKLKRTVDACLVKTQILIWFNQLNTE